MMKKVIGILIVVMTISVGSSSVGISEARNSEKNEVIAGDGLGTADPDPLILLMIKNDKA